MVQLNVPRTLARDAGLPNNQSGFPNNHVSCHTDTLSRKARSHKGSTLRPNQADRREVKCADLDEEEGGEEAGDEVGPRVVADWLLQMGARSVLLIHSLKSGCWERSMGEGKHSAGMLERGSQHWLASGNETGPL